MVENLQFSFFLLHNTTRFDTVAPLLSLSLFSLDFLSFVLDRAHFRSLLFSPAAGQSYFLCDVRNLHFFFLYRGTLTMIQGRTDVGGEGEHN